MIMKKFISFILCLLLLCSISVIAFATNVNAIQPDTNIIVIGVTGQDVPVVGHLPTHHNNGSSIIIISNEYLEGVYRNPITENPYPQQPTQKETETTTIDDSEITIPTESASDKTIDPTELGKEIFELTNKEREEYELMPLTYNDDIQAAADIRAKEIAQHFSHTRPDGSSCHTVVEDIDYYVTGENLIKADNPIATAEQMLKTWMNSEGHRNNILLADYESMAVGVYVTDDITYAVQIFLG